jgi:hypothetical protein
MYYRHITIVNDNCRVIRMTLQDVALLAIIMTIELSFMLLENINSTGITNDCHSHIFIIQAPVR